jgi:hypothetical protein
MFDGNNQQTITATHVKVGIKMDFKHALHITYGTQFASHCYKYYEGTKLQTYM